MTTTYDAWIKKTPKTWTPSSVVSPSILPPVDLDRDDVRVYHPSVPRLFIRYRRSGGVFGGGTYYAVYHRAGRTHRQPLDKVGAITPAEAVTRAVTLFAAACDPTRDPAAERAAATAAHANIFRAFIGPYVTHLRVVKGCKADHPTQVERYLTRYFPDLLDRQLNSINRADCADAVARLLTPGPAWTGGTSVASNARSALSAYFEWLISTGRCELNPVARTLSYKKTEGRERNLTETELGAVLRAVDPGTRTGRLVKLLVLTGCRRAQIGSLRKSWVHLDGPVPAIHLPGKDEAGWADIKGGSKNGKAFTIPLSRQAVELLREQLLRSPVDTEFVFGRSGAAGGFSGFGTIAADLHEKLGDTVPAWTLHDLRRTFVTLATDVLGLSRDILDACLNHAVGSSVSRIYNRSTLVEQRLQAAQAWADYCDSLTQPAAPKLKLVAA